MYLKLIVILSALLLVTSCTDQQQKSVQTAATPPKALATEHDGIRTETLHLFDQARSRAVPVVLYSAALGGKSVGQGPRRKLAILNHGYGVKNTDYRFIASNLVAQGYLVASIQHELPTDAPMAMTNNIMQDRKPHWERGVQNMLFVLRELRKTQRKLDDKSLLVVGHSNGGDMAMLFAQQHPELVREVISLDNRRMALPRTRQPRILSLRSSDQVADDGVLPTPAEQEQFGIQIVPMKNLTHNDIWDGVREEKKREVNTVINAFLTTP